MSTLKSKSRDVEICQRLAEVRQAFAGARGQSRFAALLGLRPSTWSNYEKSRIPPVSLLVDIAELTGRSLHWLATGRIDPGPIPAGLNSAEHWPILKRVGRLLDDRPASIAALAAFLDLLEQKSLIEQSQQGLGQAVGDSPGRSHERPAVWPDFGRWIPVFGRAAAGLPRFWSEVDGQAPAVSDGKTLDELICRAATLTDATSRLAVFESRRGGGRRGRVGEQSGQPVQVRLVQLDQPLTDYQLTEFIDAPQIAERHQPLFGLRLDGDSMHPMFADGTIVLCSPSEPARPGHPAVIRLTGQIGLTCKIYRPRESFVRLVAANDKYEPQEFPALQIEWALSVLGSVSLDR